MLSKCLLRCLAILASKASHFHKMGSKKMSNFMLLISTGCIFLKFELEFDIILINIR